MGDTQSYEHRGVAPRALSQLFSEINSRMEIEFTVTCTYMEIYNERIYDLLTDLSNPDQACDYTIAEERDGRGTFVRGLTEIQVHNETEAMNLLFSGELAKTTATHKLNRKSNRSHSIFTIFIQQRQRSGVSEKVSHSKLHLVDLAGSERLKKTMDTQEGPLGNEITRKESMNINQSLAYLEQCVVALSRRSQAGGASNYVPFRQSKLTNLLKDCLGANCLTLMIACVWGEADHLEETISTLRLASRMMHVQNEIVAVETIDSSALIKKQAKIIRALKQELLMHDALVERTGVSYDPYTPEAQEEIRQMIEKYVEAPELEEEEILDIKSYRQMLEICRQFKTLLLQSRSELHRYRTGMMEDGTWNSTAAGGAGTRPTSSMGGDFGFADDFNGNTSSKTVGEAVKGPKSGFGLGVASNDSRPPGGFNGMAATINSSTSHANNNANNNLSKSVTFGAATKGMEMGSVNNNASSPTNRAMKGFSSNNDSKFANSSTAPLTSSPALDNYLLGEGSAYYEDFTRAKEAVQDVKRRVQDASQYVNDAKLRIDRLQDSLNQRKTSRIELLKKSGLTVSEMEEIVDEEEFQCMKDLREAKRSYQNAFQQWQRLRSTLAESKQKVEDCKQRMARAYQQWSGGNGMLGGPISRTNSAGASSNSITNNSNFLETTISPEGQGDGDDDPLDDQEAFDRLEMERVLAVDPDSMAYFQAQKTQRAYMTQNSGSIRQMQKNKRIR